MTSNPTRLAIVFSGAGTNLKNLAAHIHTEHVATTLELAICNRPDAKGLEFCSDNNIPHELIDHTNYSDRAEFDATMQTALQAADIEFICAAGFMRLMTPEFVRHWQDRILNIHPSLLPAYKGLHTHRRVLEAGDKTHGCTVHLMRPEMDEGPILVQRQIDVLPDDTENTLAARVMEQELIAYPEALDMMLARLRR